MLALRVADVSTSHSLFVPMQVTLTVDLHLFQMMVYSKEKNGQFLVCADNAQLIGMRGSAPPSEQSQSKIVALTSDAETIPSIARNEMVFSMEKMQVPQEWRLCIFVSLI
jgi:hypothetical protein